MCTGTVKAQGQWCEGPGAGPGSVYWPGIQGGTPSPRALMETALAPCASLSSFRTWDSLSTAASVLEGPLETGTLCLLLILSSSGLFKGTVTLRLSDRGTLCVSVSHTQLLCTHEDVLERFLCAACCTLKFSVLFYFLAF